MELLAGLVGLGRQEDAHVAAFQLGFLVHGTGLGTLGSKVQQQVLADVGVGHLTAAEADGDLHTVAVSQELLGRADFGVEVANVDTGGHADLFDFHHMLVLLGFLFLLGLLKAELAVVHELAHRGNCIGGDLHQVQTGLVGITLSLGSGHNAQLTAVSSLSRISSLI